MKELNLLLMASPFNVSLDSAAGRKRIRDMEGKTLVLTIESVKKICEEILSIKNKKDICFFWQFAMKNFAVMNKEEMDVQMRGWCKQAKEGVLTVMECNNTETDFNGKMIYGLVITPNMECSLCPISLAIGMMVSGFGYFFTSKANRDAVFQFLKKKSVWTPEE